MKSNMLCALMIAMFLVSTVAFGEIIDYGTGTSSSATATASKGDPEDDDDDSGWYLYYTTEAAECEWYLEGDAYARGKTNKYGGEGWVYAAAVADSDGYCKYQDLPFDAHVDIDWDTEGFWQQDGPYGNSVRKTGSFEAYEGVYSEHVVLAVAQIEEGTVSVASAYAEATAYNEMSLTE